MSASGLDQDDLRLAITGPPSKERDAALMRLIEQAWQRGWVACLEAIGGIEERLRAGMPETPQ